MNGLLWVILIFVLQAVIAALAKRAQKNAAWRSSQAAKANTTGNRAAVQPLQRANPANATNPSSSAVLPPRPTTVGQAPTAVSVVPINPALSKPTQFKAPPFKVVRPNLVVPSGAARFETNAAAQRFPTQQLRKTPPMAVPGAQPTVPEREEAEAMSSRARVAESVAKIRSIESSIAARQVTGLGPSFSKKAVSHRVPSAGGGASTSVSAARIAEVFRNPRRIREAIILSEIIGPPRGAR